MASTTKCLSLTARAALFRAPCRARRRFPMPAFRAFATTPRIKANPEDDDGPVDTDQIIARILAEDKTLSPDDRTQLEDMANGLNEAADQRTIYGDLRNFDEMVPPDAPVEREPKIIPGFFSLEEENEDPGEDPDFESDDITSLAHGELEEHREMREFARVIAWDMPLLFKHAKPFEAPTAAQPLRFRYTTYMGETHPASRKVVLTFSPSSLPDLTPVQISKLIKLLGVRYNPLTTTAKMSCELFPTPAQNKRYLGDLIGKLLVEARDGKDTFEDVPYDFRHIKPKKNYVFPESWKLTDEKMEALEQGRTERRRLEIDRSVAGELVDGTRVIEQMLSGRKTRVMEPERVPLPAAGPRGTLKEPVRRELGVR